MKLIDKLTKDQTRVVGLLGAACCLALIVLIAVARTSAQRQATTGGHFTPPAFESAAVTGVPEVDDKLGWAELSVREGYVVHVCGVLRADADGSVPVWFASDAGNDVWLKLRVCDEEDYVLGESGVLRPGEYVERVRLKSVPPADTPVVLYVMGYEPETYYSAGTVSLATTLEVG